MRPRFSLGCAVYALLLWLALTAIVALSRAP